MTKKKNSEMKMILYRDINQASKNFPRIINLEFIQIISLEKQTKTSNPICKKCNKKMKSKGKGQGFECIRCGKKSSRKINEMVTRNLAPQLYLPKISAHRHLTRPQQRQGIQNKSTNFKNSLSWFCVYQN